MKIASGMKAELKKFGTENVRALLFPGYTTPLGLSPTLAKIRQHSFEREAALEWLRKQDRAARRRANVLYVITIITMIAACIAAFAACIAAWPEVNEWLQR